MAPDLHSAQPPQTPADNTRLTEEPPRVGPPANTIPRQAMNSCDTLLCAVITELADDGHARSAADLSSRPLPT